MSKKAAFNKNPAFNAKKDAVAVRNTRPVYTPAREINAQAVVKKKGK